MNNPQYTQEQAQLLYDVLIHHSAETLQPDFNAEQSSQLDSALATLRMELSLFIAEGYRDDYSTEDSYRDYSENDEDDYYQQDWLDDGQ